MPYEFMKNGEAGGRRNHAVDWMKAIGIALVVYGHSEAVPVALKKAIYGFHMPLFFFVSGLLTNRGKLDVTFKKLISGRVSRLASDYFLFAAVNYLFWLLLFRRFNVNDTGDLNAAMPVLGIIYGSGSRMDLLQPGVLWFFPCLVSATILMWITCRLPLAARTAVIILITLAGFYFGRLIMPWELESAMMALPFMWAGFAFREIMPLVQSLPKFAHLAASSAMAAVSWHASNNNAKIDMRSGDYGAAHLFAVSSMCGILSILFFSMLMPKCALAEKTSNSTILIFPLHNIIFILLAGIYTYVFNLPDSFRNQPITGIAATAFIIILFLAISNPVLIMMNRIRGLL